MKSPRIARQRPGVRRSSGAFERPSAYAQLQGAGALQNATATALPVGWTWSQLKFVALACEGGPV